MINFAPDSGKTMKIYISTDIDNFDLDAALRDISSQRREQALRFKYERGRRTCVLAYQLLKQALSEEYGNSENPLFSYGEHGKPLLVGHPEIHFNLSHCREAVACAVSDRPIGIDVESIREMRDGLVHYTMNDEEQRLIAAAERPEAAFIRLWTMKEARLKLTGRGITDNMKTVIDDSVRFTTVECLEHNYIYTICENKE